MAGNLILRDRDNGNNLWVPLQADCFFQISFLSFLLSKIIFSDRFFCSAYMDHYSSCGGSVYLACRFLCLTVSIENTTDPFGISCCFSESQTKGLRLFTLRAGYMEVVDLDGIFRREGIVGNTIFYGLEEISSSNIFIKIFALIKKLFPTFVQFHKLPAMKLHGVMTRYELDTDSQPYDVVGQTPRQ